jgi:DNA-binding SARP family transcriptional activator/tetratricopeptide (TPR) repeat protein
MSVQPQLLLFGPPKLVSDNAEIAKMFPAKTYLLAALLLLRVPRTASRQSIATLLWEDAPHTVGLANSRRLLARIREGEASLGWELFSISHDSIGLRDNGEWTDVARFLSERPPASKAELDALFALYRGPLLEGVTGIGIDLGKWLDAERDKLQRRLLDLGLRGGRGVGGAEAVYTLERLSQLAPYSDEVCQDLMTAFAGGGHSQDVVRTFQKFRSAMRDDLQRQPAAETEALFLRLTRQRIEPRTEARPAAAEALHRHREGDMSQPQASPNVVRIPRMAILMPVLSQGAAPASEVLPMASALLEDVTIGLCRLRSVAMIAPHSAWQFSKPGTLEAIRPFGIDYVLETHVGGHRLKGQPAGLAVKLIHAGTRRIVWAEKYSLAEAEAPERYRNLTNWIVRTLADAVEQAELVNHSIVRDPGAYGLYLNGRQHMRGLDLPSIRRARKLFTAAIEAAPGFSLPYSAVARTLVFEWVLRAQNNRELLEEARRMALRAIELDPFDGDGHRELGRAALYLGELDTSLRDFEDAEQYAPHHADLLADYADALMHNSDAGGAKRRIDAALELNPLPPDDYLWTVGGVNFFTGNYEQALTSLQRMKNTDPALRLMAACAVRAGDKGQARKLRERALALNPDFTIESWISTLPLRAEHHRNEYADALKAAGFH